MKKLNINGKDYIKLETLREEIRHLRKDIPLLYGRFSKEEQAMVHLAYNDIICIFPPIRISSPRTVFYLPWLILSCLILSALYVA